jgi:two-component system, OmpR family, sensor kinase
MRRWSLRSRLAAASAVAILVALALLGIAATLVVEDQLRGTVDSDLRRRAVDVAQLAALTPGLLEARGALDIGSGGRQLWVEVRDRNGRIVARSDALRGRLLPGNAARERALREGRTGFADDRLGEEPIRIYAAPLAATDGAAGGGTVVVASSMGDIEDIFGRLREAIALAALAAALLGGVLATALTSRGLRPLRRLAHGARAISEAPDMGSRLPAEPTHDEVGELAYSLNRMLDALDHAREAERRLLADASHELRTPVTSLRGNAAFARRHGADAELLADLEADAERLARLVEDLLALEREAGAELPGEEVDLEEVVAAVVDAPGIELGESPLLDALAAADTGAALDRPGADGPAVDGTVEPVGGPRVVVGDTAPLVVRGQPGPLARALRNLVENACVHGPVDGEVRVSLTRRGDEAVLAVSDDGTGIPPDQAASAPRRFWRGPDAAAGGRPGSGLGLAIVAATAARHGGRLEIAGATVALALPLVRELSKPARTVVP